jgi:DNA-binding NarL/FixJ family response regulator
MATNLLRDGFVRAAALLDNVVDPIRSAATADLPIAYFSRAVSFDTLCRGILQLAGGTPMSDTTPATMNGSGVTPGNPYRRESMISQLSRLTPRETEVMRLIATGNTVKDCAKILRLAQSTVDNHKTRLMKKLDVHKSSDLTRLAIRAGLIVA